MALVSQTTPSLYGGVSQQSPIQRATNQCEDADNCSFTVASGVSKRPPLETINQLTSTDMSGTFFHWISDSNNERYLLSITSTGDISVYRTSDGQKLNVSNDIANPYLICTDAVTDLRAYTVESKTYIVNTSIDVALDAHVSGGTLTGTVQTLQDTALDSAPEGSIYAIIGDTDNSFDTFYAKKVSGKWIEWAKPGIQDRLLATSMPHSLELFFDEIDPFGVRFDFQVETWEDKLVGDEKSNKFPSFVGGKITGIFFASDRLSFLSGSAVSMSETSEYHNFFRTTIVDVLATARIDIKEASDDSTSLYYAKPLGTNIMTFSQNKQLALAGDPLLTPQTVGMTLATSYRSSITCEPQNAGSNLYFVVESGDSSEIREMYVSNDTISTTADNITAHVPRYIPKGVRLLAVQNNLDFLCVYSDETPNKLWVNQYTYSGDRKVQSAWGSWTFNSAIKILDIETIDHHLYVVYSHTRPDGVNPDIVGTYLGRINLKPNDSGISTEFHHPINLDFLQKLVGTYDAPSNTTTFTSVTPFVHDIHLNEVLIVKGKGWTDFGRYYASGTPYPFYRLSNDNSFYLVGDWTTGDLFMGVPYVQNFQLSPYYFKDGNGVNTDVRCQIRSLTLSFSDTIYFDTVVTRGNEEAVDKIIPELFQTYSARTLGSIYFDTNVPQLVTGTYTFPILSQNKDVTVSIRNDSYMPCNIQTIAYKSLISSRLR